MALEYAPKGKLLDLVLLLHGKNKVDLLKRMTRLWFGQLVQGLDHLHSFNFAHLDIKHDNILLDQNLNIKIADFGFTHKVAPLYGLTDEQRLTINYAPPEVLQYKGPYNGFKSDIFALGAVFYSALTKEYPECDHPQWSADHIAAYSANLLRLIERMLSTDPV
jgi:MAP/microtubule affinity-regulating kinase